MAENVEPPVRLPGMGDAAKPASFGARRRSMVVKEHTEAAEADRRSELDAARAEMGRKSDGAVFAALEAREAELASLKGLSNPDEETF